MTRVRVVLLIAAALTTLGLTACSKDEETFAAVAALTTEESTGTGAATRNSTGTGDSIPTSTGTGTPTGTAIPAPTPTASSTSSPCGARPLRPCTLRDWMKANAGPAMMAQDFDGLAEALDWVATVAPAGYPNWASIARDGASAAQVLDLEAVRAACRSCHTQYKEQYKRELHERPI
jgi:hypothetical protein